MPAPIAGQTAYNAFIQPLIDRYGYVENGVRVGGGTVGYGSQFDDARVLPRRRPGRPTTSPSAATISARSAPRLSAVRRRRGPGPQLERLGPDHRCPAGGTNLAGTPIFYTARFQQQTTGAAAPIRSEYHSQSFEVNDTIRWQDWSFNLGVLASRDTLYGQGLREDASTLSGYVLAPGNKYKMYEIPFSKMIQPRVGATWAYNGTDTVYGSYARYNPRRARCRARRRGTAT